MTAIKKIAEILGWLATVAGMSLCFFVFLSVAMRYFFGSPFHFTEEFVGLLFCSMSFLAIPVAETQCLHIRLEMLLQHLKPKMQIVLHWFSVSVLTIYCSILFYHAYNYMALSFQINAKTDDSDLLIYPWFLAILASLMSFVVAVIAKQVKSVKTTSKQAKRS